MNNKHRIVTFTDGVAWVEITNDLHPFLALEDNKTLFINPDLSLVQGVPPDFWTVKDGKIVALEGQELEDRIKINDEYSLSNNDVICDIYKRIQEVVELNKALEQKTQSDLEKLNEVQCIRLNDEVDELKRRNSVILQIIENSSIVVHTKISNELAQIENIMEADRNLRDSITNDLKLNMASNDNNIKNLLNETVRSIEDKIQVVNEELIEADSVSHVFLNNEISENRLAIIKINNYLDKKDQEI